MENQYFDRDLSWLAFNHRVLQEAENPDLPPLERLRFLAIFSSNLDEFFRVRVASHRQLARLKKKTKAKIGITPAALIQSINQEVVELQEQFDRWYRESILPELAARGIQVANSDKVKNIQADEDAAIKEFFNEKVAPLIELIPFPKVGEAPFLEAGKLYLLVDARKKGSSAFFLIRIPDQAPRFFTHQLGEKQYRTWFLDDVIRRCLPKILPDWSSFQSWAIHISRDAELYIEDEYSGDLIEKIRKSLGKRDLGTPTRFLSDSTMPARALEFCRRRFELDPLDLILGGRYHRLNDFWTFPNPEGILEEFPPMPPQNVPVFDEAESMFELVRAQDRMVHYPYQKFDYLVRFLDEALLLPGIKSIHITLYRVGDRSAASQRLVEAAQKGISVNVFLEIKARFDEENNLYWAEKLEEAGAKVSYSIPGLKVHTKLCLITTLSEQFAYISTGNFHEKTAKIYADDAIFTAKEEITREVTQVFQLLAGDISQQKFKYVQVAPLHMRKGFARLIRKEIKLGPKGKMILKLNSLEDKGMIDLLYEASRAGVQIDIIVRGICCLMPGVPGMSENIRVRSLVGRWLEHSRVYYFKQGGKDKLYISSADWMGRNLDKRIEVAVPILDKTLKAEMMSILALQLADNVKARAIDATQSNVYIRSEGPSINAQEATYHLFKG